jgi:hypothetical protein
MKLLPILIVGLVIIAVVSLVMWKKESDKEKNERDKEMAERKQACDSNCQVQTDRCLNECSGQCLEKNDDTCIFRCQELCAAGKASCMNACSNPN